MNPKTDQNGILGLKASVGCPCAPLDHQNGAQGAQDGATGLPNHSFECLVTPKSSTKVPKPLQES